MYVGRSEEVAEGEQLGAGVGAARAYTARADSQWVCRVAIAMELILAV
jgi:hypothetical protein